MSYNIFITEVTDTKSTTGSLSEEILAEIIDLKNSKYQHKITNLQNQRKRFPNNPLANHQAVTVSLNKGYLDSREFCLHKPEQAANVKAIEAIAKEKNIVLKNINNNKSNFSNSSDSSDTNDDQIRTEKTTAIWLCIDSNKIAQDPTYSDDLQKKLTHLKTNFPTIPILLLSKLALKTANTNQRKITFADLYNKQFKTLNVEIFDEFSYKVLLKITTALCVYIKNPKSYSRLPSVRLIYEDIVSESESDFDSDSDVEKLELPPYFPVVDLWLGKILGSFWRTCASLACIGILLSLLFVPVVGQTIGASAFIAIAIGFFGLPTLATVGSLLAAMTPLWLGQLLKETAQICRGILIPLIKLLKAWQDLTDDDLKTRDKSWLSASLEDLTNTPLTEPSFWLCTLPTTLLVVLIQPFYLLVEGTFCAGKLLTGINSDKTIVKSIFNYVTAYNSKTNLEETAHYQITAKQPTYTHLKKKFGTTSISSDDEASSEQSETDNKDSNDEGEKHLSSQILVAQDNDVPGCLSLLKSYLPFSR